MTRHTGFSVDGKPFLSIGGQARNSSAFTPEDAEHACRSVDALGGNTVAFPVSWEAFEPEEGVFDRDGVIRLIDRVRSWGLQLVVLWFATWKNGTMEYCPAWVKADQARFPRTLYPNGEPTYVLSCHSEENRDADARAFSALMEVIRDHDAGVGTVICVQVENESGIYAPVRRDFGSDGERDFSAAVPEELLSRARAGDGSRLARLWEDGGRVDGGSWAEVFGVDGAEACTAWHIARYVDAVAEAGKAVHDIPLSVNAWADTGAWGVAGLDYPSGGPVFSTAALDIWRTAVSSIDLICPDVYVAAPEAYREMVDAYAFSGGEPQPLFVPESANGNPNPSLMFHSVVERGAIGQHLFAVEELVDPDGAVRERGLPFARSFAMLRNAEPLLHRLRGTDAVHGVCQVPGQRGVLIRARGWLCSVSFSGPDFRWNGTDYRHLDGLSDEFVQRTDLADELGRGMIAQTADDEFCLVGHRMRVSFHRVPPVDGSVPYSLISPVHQAASLPTLSLDEGRIDDDGRFVVDRPRTGDEARHGVWLAADCGVVRVRLDPRG